MYRITATILAVTLCQSSLSAQPSQYVPDVLELDGATTVAFPANESLELEGGSTIEFWIQPEWDETPDFDPVVLSYTGGSGASYLVTVLRGKDGLGIMSGDKYMAVPFDFSDGKMHHVALIDYGDETEVLVDKAVIAEVSITLESRPADGLFIGTSDGTNNPFTGALAALRLWSVPVEPETLMQWSMRDVLIDSDAPHPDLPFLVGLSDFATLDFRVASLTQQTSNKGN